MSYLSSEPTTAEHMSPLPVGPIAMELAALDLSALISGTRRVAVVWTVLSMVMFDVDPRSGHGIIVIAYWSWPVMGLVAVAHKLRKCGIL
jgi:hypothetical protein